MKTVAIIGAGPSGLVAAKTLLHDTPKDTFQVTVFEKANRIGGLWPTSEHDKSEDGMVSPDMCTNQSRHTVSFSDLAWGERERSFPRAWEVGKYLERYKNRFGGSQVKMDVKLGCEVVGMRIEEGRWRVCVRDSGVGYEGKANEEGKVFDHLIVATGFFGKPKIPERLKDVKIPVWHSSKVRDLRTFLSDGGKRSLGSLQQRNIVVVGGQMSGVEIAANIAFQISSLANSPVKAGEETLEEMEKWTVTHAVQRPVWVLPLFFPRDPEAEVIGSDGEVIKNKNFSPEFLPLDLVNYDLAFRPEGLIQNNSGHITVDSAKKTHGFMEKYIGTGQTDLGAPILAMKGEGVRSEPPMLAVSDYYAEFVRSGMIRVVQGRMKGCEESGMRIQIEDATGKVDQISDIAAIVCATGFDASASLSFLAEELLQKLQFDPTDDAFPLALNIHSTVNRSIPSLGFVGFYRSPYWGVMEMQARYLTKLWSGDTKAQQALEDDKTMDSMLNLRNDPRRAQFPMGDYIYLMESFSSILGIPRTEPSNSNKTGPGRTGIVLPARYRSHNDPYIDSIRALRIVDEIFISSSRGLFTPRATFRALQGIWSLSRTITSQLPTFPSGTLSGTAAFLPRFPTDGGADTDMEYLYLEEGDFKLSWGGSMKAKRGYVWRYRENRDRIEVFFVQGDGKSVDYFFHGLEFLVEEGERKRGWDEPWRARSSHLCVEDLYNVTYEFFFSGTTIEKWTSRYIVKGPKKDYMIENLYTRPGRELGSGLVG